MNQENSPEKYLRFTLLPRFLFGKVGYCPCFPSGYLLPDGYPRPQRIRDGLEEIEGVSKPQQLQNSENFPPNGRRNWLEHHFAKYHSCIFLTGGFFFGFTTQIGRAHRIGKKGISVSRFAQPAWFDFHWSTCFSSIQKPSSHPTGKIWPSVYKRQRCSYNDEKWVDAMMNNGMWDKLISLTLLGVDVRSADIFADFAMDARPSDIQVGWVVTHQLWNGKKPAHGYPSGTAHWNIDLWLVRLKDVYKKKIPVPEITHC